MKTIALSDLELNLIHGLLAYEEIRLKKAYKILSKNGDNFGNTKNYIEQVNKLRMKFTTMDDTEDYFDLISRKRIRYELGESTMPKRYRDFCLRVIDSERLTPTVDINTPKEDFRNWIVDNWNTAVFDCIGFALETMVVDAKKDMTDVVDRDETVDFISERIKDGLLNVLDTYEVEV